MDKHKKPSGRIGEISIYAKGRGPGPYVRNVQFPDHKDILEYMLLKRALLALVPDRVWYLDQDMTVVPNDENDLDFTLQFEDSHAYLDLMEIAPLEKVHGSYEAAPYHRVVGEFVDSIVAKIMAKNRHYAGIRDVPKHLLLYSTDWRFLLGPRDIGLLRLILDEVSPDFCTITYYSRYGTSENGSAELLFPVDDFELPDETKETLRNRIVLIGKLNEIDSDEDGQAVISFSNPALKFGIDGVSYVIAKDLTREGLATKVYAVMLEGFLLSSTGDAR